MPSLQSFMIRHFANGFLLGCAASLLLVLLNPGSPGANLAGEGLAGLFLVTYALGAPCGAGSLATALLMNCE